MPSLRPKIPKAISTPEQKCIGFALGRVDAEVAHERRAIGVPAGRQAAIEGGSAKKIVAGDTSHVGRHDAGWTSAAALVAKAPAVAFERTVPKELIKDRGSVVAPHGGKIAKVRRHAATVNEKREIGRK
jgi:hypothetical protein